MAGEPLVTAVADEHEAAERAAEVLATALDASRTVRGAAPRSLSGGSMGRVYELLGERLSDWSDVHFWFSDERCVPPDHEESIFRLVQETLDAPGAEIHRAPGELGPDEGALAYARALDDVVLDVALLGMGPDGHTASLFPHHPGLSAQGLTRRRARLAQAAAPGEPGAADPPARRGSGAAVPVAVRSAFVYDEKRAARVMQLDEREVIKDKRLLVQCGVVLSLVMVGFIAHGALDIDPSLVALLGAGALVALSRTEPAEFLEEVEWMTLVFFMGLFVMVGALVEVGVISSVGTWLADAVGGNYLLAGTALIFGSAALSGLIDNIPYVATLAPIVKDLVDAGGGSPEAASLWWALALGSDLGGNATAVGASANVVIIGIAARNGHPISFWHFTKYGLVVTAVTVTIAWAYFALRYFALA